MNNVISFLSKGFSETIIRNLGIMPMFEIFFLIFVILLILTALIFLIDIRLHARDKKTFLPNESVVSGSLVCGSYGFILAFLIVSMSSINQKATEYVSDEVNSLVGIIRNSKNLDNASQIQSAVQNYARYIVEKQWPYLESGDIGAAWRLSEESIIPLYQVIHDSKPQGKIQEGFYGYLLGSLNAVDKAHQNRLMLADLHLSVPLWRGIILMTFFVLWILVRMNPWGKPFSFISIIVPEVVIALLLSLLIALNYPFAGTMSVSKEVYYEWLNSFVRINS